MGSHISSCQGLSNLYSRLTSPQHPTAHLTWHPSWTLRTQQSKSTLTFWHTLNGSHRCNWTPTIPKLYHAINSIDGITLHPSQNIQELVEIPFLDPCMPSISRPVDSAHQLQAEFTHFSPSISTTPSCPHSPTSLTAARLSLLSTPSILHSVAVKILNL